MDYYKNWQSWRHGIFQKMEGKWWLVAAVPSIEEGQKLLPQYEGKTSWQLKVMSFEEAEQANHTLPDRIKTLETLSGLQVKHYKDKNENVFQFFDKDKCIKSCFTYKNAKGFAEGIAYKLL